MATQNWKTLSVRVTEEEENALKILCQKRGQNKHALLRDTVLKELEPLLKPGHLPIGEGIPLLGQHMIKYNPEKDNFTWQIDLGAQGVNCLAEDIPTSFMQSLFVELGRALEERKSIERRTGKKKTVIPKVLLKYEERKYARIRVKV